MNEKYKKLRRFNITNVVFDVFNKEGSTQSVASIISSMDFSEKSDKSYSFLSEKEDRFINSTISETLAQNFIATLPFESYKKFITPEWISFGKDYDFPLAREFSSHHALLFHLAEIGYEKAKIDDSFSNDYRRIFLPHVLDVKSVVEHRKEESEDFFKSYYELFKKCYSQDQELRKVESKKMNFKFKPKNDWLFDLMINRTRYSQFDEPEHVRDVLLHLVKVPQAKIFLDDCLNQIEHRAKDLKSNIKSNIMSDDTVLTAALSTYDVETIEKLMKSFNLSVDWCVNTIDNELKSRWDNLQDSREDYFNNKLGLSFLWLNSKEPSSLSHIGLLSLTNNLEIKTFLQENLNIENNLPKNSTNKTIPNLKYKEYILMSDLLNAYTHDTLGLESNEIKKPSQWKLGEKLKELQISKITYELKNFEKVVENVVYLLENNFGTELNKNKNVQALLKNKPLKDFFEKWSRSYYLENILDSTSSPVKSSSKIKI